MGSPPSSSSVASVSASISRPLPVLPEWAPRREIIHAVFASRRGLLPAVRALLDFLAERFEELEED